MTDAPDELESAMILGDPAESVSLDTIKAMARAVRDAGYGNLEAERARIVERLGNLLLDSVYSSPHSRHEFPVLREAVLIVKGEA